MVCHKLELHPRYKRGRDNITKYPKSIAVISRKTTGGRDEKSHRNVVFTQEISHRQHTYQRTWVRNDNGVFIGCFHYYVYYLIDYFI